MGFANGLEMANMTIKIYEFGLKETSAILGNFLSLPFASTTTSIHLRLTARTEEKDRRRRKGQAVGGEGRKEGPGRTSKVTRAGRPWQQGIASIATRLYRKERWDGRKGDKGIRRY